MPSGLYDEAIEAFTEAIALDPNLAGFYNMWGYCCSKVENHNEVLEDLNKAVELDSEDARNYMLRWAVYGILGNQVLAMANLKVAAQMGDEKAQGIRRRKGVNWKMPSYSNLQSR